MRSWREHPASARDRQRFFYEDVPPGVESDGHVATEEERDSSDSYSTVDTEDFHYARQYNHTDRYFDGLTTSLDRWSHCTILSSFR